MQIYVFPVAPNPTKVRLYIHEKNHAGAGIKIEEVLVNLPGNEQHQPEHLARNPLGKLPVLETDDGVYLTESLAIIQYLEELHPEPAMIGRTPLERAQALEVERIAELTVQRIISEIVHATKSPLGLPPNAAVADHFREQLPTGLAVLEAKLSDGRPFLLGPKPTIADLTLQSGLHFGRMIQLELDPKFELLTKWNESFRKRDSAQEVLVF